LCCIVTKYSNITLKWNEPDWCMALLKPKLFQVRKNFFFYIGQCIFSGWLWKNAPILNISSHTFLSHASFCSLRNRFFSFLNNCNQFNQNCNNFNQNDKSWSVCHPNLRSHGNCLQLFLYIMIWYGIVHLSIKKCHPCPVYMYSLTILNI
jgi:hypothetical protein